MRPITELAIGGMVMVVLAHSLVAPHGANERSMVISSLL